MSRTVQCTVEGRVQGVYFRAFTRDEALSLGLSGWVRNLPDGRVETVAQGPDEAVERFRAFLHKGSPFSRVDAVHCQELEGSEAFSGFEIRR